MAGLGASAGGVQALSEFFGHVSEDSGIAWVVILHLAPERDSKLAELLQTVTLLPVIRVTKRMTIRPNHVYVISPGQHLQLEGETLMVSPHLNEEERRAPVDIFFRSLADNFGTRAVGVVLSGTGANGSMGLKHIKEMGGVVFVQNPREAEFNEMPRNAIATELVDEILPVALIPEKIESYRNAIGHVVIATDPKKRPKDQQQALREIFGQLRLRTGHDFSNYKRPTLLRRMERRITVRNLPDLPAYAAYIQQNPEEVHALLKDLLISVTSFFRDKKAFELLEEEILTGLISAKKPEEPLRIWVAGCATGEEAYSLAMLCAEQTLGAMDAPKVQIFATDIDEAAIAVARDGYYTLNDAADVPAERLRRFFNKEGDGFRVRREIREMVLFANHNFIKDPPFSNLDLVSCRNVMIYLNHVAQERVMETFHFALKPGGYLFLGSAETADGAVDLFSAYSREHHIYQSRPVFRHSIPVPESVPPLRQEKSAGPVRLAPSKESRQERMTFGELHLRMLEQYAPPSIVVNEEYDILHLSENAGRYLEVGGGEPSQNLLKLVRPELRSELRAALLLAVQRQEPVVTRDLVSGAAGKTETLRIHVRPVLRPDDAARGFLLVIFDRQAEAAAKTEMFVSTDEPVVLQLEEELVRLKTELRLSREQHDYDAEELKASNEELQAMNEELRSATEELETSKEELQSINEELRTVNQELKVKVDETTMMSNNLQNLINSTDIATIFLDRAQRVHLFSPAAREIFNLIPADFGRPLSDITSRLDYTGLSEDAEWVLNKLQPVEREVTTKDEKVYMMRVLPYRTVEDKINGVVVTFFDITKRKRMEEALRASEERARMLIESAKDYAIFTQDLDRRVNSWNAGAQMMFGYTEGEIIDQLADIMFVPEDREKGAPIQEAEKALKQGRAENERWHVRKDGSRFYGSGLVRPLLDGKGTAIGFVKIMRDLTEQKQAEEALRESEDRFRAVANLVPDLLWSHDAHGMMFWNSQRWYEYTGQTPEEALGKGWLQVIHPEDRDETRFRFETAIRTGASLRHEHRMYQAASGTYRWFLVQAEPVRDQQGQILHWFGSATEIEDLKTTQESLQESEERLRVMLESATDYAVITLDTEGNISGWSKGAELIFGYTESEVLGKYTDIIFTPEDRTARQPEKEIESARTEGCAIDERWHLRSDGSRFFMSGVMRPIYNPLLIGYVKVARDITERKLLEQQKDDFIGIASHELKTPVTSIKAYAEILKEKFWQAKDAKNAELMQKLDLQVDRLSELINTLLSSTKVTEGRLELRPEPFDLCRLLGELAEGWQRLSGRHRIRLECEEIPEIEADREQITQVMTNLVSNAIKYSPDGGDVIISATSNGKELSVCVQDFGVGIPEGLQDKLFGRFFRVNNPKLQTFPGMGLGLYICAGIIKRHGGTLKVQSKEGKGSSFCFTIPISMAITRS